MLEDAIGVNALADDAKRAATARISFAMVGVGGVRLV